MLLDGSCHNQDVDHETSSTHELGYDQHHLNTEVDQLNQSDDRSVTQEDQKSFLSLAKECENFESRFITSDDTAISSVINQLEHDESASSLSRNKMKISIGEGTGEDHDGFQSPTKVMDTISSAGLKCPHAPRKPKSAPLKKRKREDVNLQDEFVNEVELVLRLLRSEEEDKRLKTARPLATDMKSMEKQ